MIGRLILRTQNPQVWRRFITLWLDLFRRRGRLSELGEALVRSLRYCAIDWLTDQTAQAWFATWRDLAGDTPELALPLRLLGAGVAYRAGRDPRARPGLRVLAVARCRPSFSDLDLVQVDLLEGPRPGALDLLAGTAEVRVLDGLAQPLCDLVAAGTIRLDTPERQSD